MVSSIDKRLREVFPCSVVEVSFLKKRTVFARRAALSAGADPQATLLSEVTADTRGLGVVVSTEVLHFLASTHILYVDACHCEDGWVIMVACFLDGAHHIQPVGFYLCPSERESLLEGLPPDDEARGAHMSVRSGKGGKHSHVIVAAGNIFLNYHLLRISGCVLISSARSGVSAMYTFFIPSNGCFQ